MKLRKVNIHLKKSEAIKPTKTEQGKRINLMQFESNGLENKRDEHKNSFLKSLKEIIILYFKLRGVGGKREKGQKSTRLWMRKET